MSLLSGASLSFLILICCLGVSLPVGRASLPVGFGICSLGVSLPVGKTFS